MPPSAVMRVAVASMARPRSASLTTGAAARRPGASSTFAGLTSRWTSPCACAWPSAAQSWRAIVDRGVDRGRRLLAQRAAGDQLHHQEEAAGLLADVVDRDDVRVVERGGGARLAQEALARLRRRRARRAA